MSPPPIFVTPLFHFFQIYENLPLNFKIFSSFSRSDLFRLHHPVEGFKYQHFPLDCVYLFEELPRGGKNCFNILRCAYFYFNRTIYFTFSRAMLT